MTTDHSRHDDDRTGDNDITEHHDPIPYDPPGYLPPGYLKHDRTDQRTTDDDVPNVYYAARDLVTHVDLGPADDEHGEPYNSLVRAVYDAAAAVLGTDNTATDLDALVTEYVCAHAMYWTGQLASTDVDEPADALVAALRTKETP